MSYESGQEAANALVAQIKSSGGKAVAIQADMLKTAVDSVTRVTIPLGRPGMPEDIARVALFLASDDSAWVTGERITASCGQRA